MLHNSFPLPKSQQELDTRNSSEAEYHASKAQQILEQYVRAAQAGDYGPAMTARDKLWKCLNSLYVCGRAVRYSQDNQAQAGAVVKQGRLGL